MLGNNVTIDDNCLIDARGAGSNGLVIEDNVIINRNCMIQAKSGPVRIGKSTSVGSNSVIVSMDGVVIEERVLTAGGCYISAGAYHLTTWMRPSWIKALLPKALFILERIPGWAPVLLCRWCAIGAGRLLEPGRLSQNVPDQAIAAGVPAKICDSGNKILARAKQERAINVKKKIFFLFKAAVTIALCAIIIWNINWKDLRDAFFNVNPILIAVVFGCMVLNIAISTIKWRILLSIHKIKFNFANLHKYYFTAVFFNNFLPTNIGGDGYRIYKTIKNESSRIGAVIAVLTERVTGILTLVFLGTLGASYLLFTDNDNGPFLRVILWISLAIILISCVCIIFLPKIAAKFSTNEKLPQKIKTFLLLIDDYRDEPLKTFQIVLVSIFFHIFTFFWMTILIKAIGSNFSVTKLAVTLMISNLAAVLPISINGIGLLDGSFVYVAGKFGMSYEHAVMVMGLNRALLIPLSLIGGLFYLKDKKAH